MNTKFFIICALFTAPFVSVAQQSSAERNAYSVAYGPSTYSRAHFSETYDANKKYTVIKLWHSNEPMSAEEKEEIASLRKLLSKKNINVLEHQWKDEEDLKKFFDDQNIKVDVDDENGLKLQAEKSSMSTSSKKVLLVLEEGKLFTICSGSTCETNTKYFFKLISHN